MQKAQVENESTTTLRSLFLEALIKWDNDSALRMSAALGFFTVLSLSPLLVIALSIASPIFGSESARAEIVRQYSAIIGKDNAQFVNWICKNQISQFRAFLQQQLVWQHWRLEQRGYSPSCKLQLTLSGASNAKKEKSCPSCGKDFFPS